MRRKLLIAFIGLGLLAQLLVPVWMLLKHHLILTRGEKVTIDVTFYDPRDLFMGHYVQLSTTQNVPQLEGVPRNYLRYYCDQRYAKALDRGVRMGKAELDVRVWRGNALAEALRIDGMPAYTYVEQLKESSPEVVQSDETRPDISEVVSVENLHYEAFPPQGQCVIVGKNLMWDTADPEEGFFFSNLKESAQEKIPCKVVTVFKEGISYLVRPQTPLSPASAYRIRFYYRRDGNLHTETTWNTFRCE